MRSNHFSADDDELDRLLSDPQRAMALRAFVQEGIDDFEAGNFEEYTDANFKTLFEGVRRRGLAILARDRS